MWDENLDDEDNQNRTTGYLILHGQPKCSLKEIKEEKWKFRAYVNILHLNNFYLII